MYVSVVFWCLLYTVSVSCHTHKRTHTHPFNGSFSGTTQVSRYQKRKTNLDFTEVRDSEWQWHQLGHMQVCTSLQTDNHASTPPLKYFLQAGCPSCRPTNSVKALKAFCFVSFGDEYKVAQGVKAGIPHRMSRSGRSSRADSGRRRARNKVPSPRKRLRTPTRSDTDRRPCRDELEHKHNTRDSA